MANEEEKQGQRQDLPKRIALKEEEWSVGLRKEACAPLSVGHKCQEGVRILRGTALALPMEQTKAHWPSAQRVPWMSRNGTIRELHHAGDDAF